MQINKKIFSVAITALLLLSILAAAAPAFAITALNSSITSPTATLANTNTTPNIPAYPIAFVDPGTAATSVTVATVGQRIVVSGIDAAAFNSVNVYWDTVSTATLIASTSAGAPPNQANPTWFNVTVTIPSATNGVHNLIVSDGVNNIGLPITVASSLSRGLTSRALPGDSITLTGNGFAATAVVTLTLTAPNGTTTIAFPPTVAANGTGSFSLTAVIPATLGSVDLSATAWTITATQAALTAITTVTLDYYVTVTPTSGPLGITATIAGRIPASTAVTVAFGTATAFTTTSGVDGKFTGTYSTVGVPLVPGATYAIVATWGPVGFTVTRTAVPGFTVNAAVPTIASLSVAAAQAGTVVTISVTGFSSFANVTLKLGTTDVNSTATDFRFGPTDITGAFTDEFTVPALTVGAYSLSVTDIYGATASAAFSILAAPVTTITTASSYLQGNTISFSITTTEVSFDVGPVATIKDPSGATWFVSLPWTLTGTVIKTVLFQDQLINTQHIILPANAPTGSWNWTVTYTPVSTHVATKATGLFTVDAVGATGGVTNAQLNSTLATINSTLNSLTTSVSALDGKVTSITGSIATITSGMTSVTASVNSLSASITSINSGVATINTKLGTVTTSLSSIDAVLGAVAGDTATLKTSLGEVTTSLASIGTTVTSIGTAVTGISGNVATIQTDLGTLKGTVTSVSGNVATIQTSLGTMQADISALKADTTSVKDSTGSLSTLIIVAIVLALLAAIAAIASIVLMRRKIAG